MPLRVISRRTKASAVPGSAPFGLPLPPADWKQMPSGISLCMIVRNEERFLEQCLRSVADLVDEINIVDTGSTDRTVEIAQSFGAKIQHREWRNDFGWARNEALAMATKRWILQLDADEELDRESAAALVSLKNAPAHHTGVWIRCANASDKYRGGGSVSHAIVRIFPNTPRIRFHGAIHEFPSLDGSVLTLPACNSPIRIVHHGYLNEIVDHRDKFARNMEIVRAAVEREPDEAFHWYNYGMTAFLGGDYTRGSEGFERMWELCRKNGNRGFTPNGLQTLADIYTEHLGQPEKGLKYAMESLRLAPRYANGHFSAGKAYTELRKYDDARSMYEQAIEDGKYVDLQYIVDDEVPVWKAPCEIGSTYVVQGDDRKAIEWFERALSKRPKVEPLRINYGKALERLNRHAEAEAIFKSVFEDFDGDQPALEYVNYLLRQRKEYDALQVIEKAYESCSPLVAAQMLLAAAAVSQRNGWGEGLTYLDRARELQPADPDVLNALEAAYNRSGDSAAIARLHEAELQFEPQVPAQFVRRFNILLGRQRYEDALACAHRGLAIDQDHAALRYSAAIACANLGRKDEALDFVNPITERDEKVFPLATYLRAAVARELGRTADAVNALQRLLAIDPGHAGALQLYAAILRQPQSTPA